MCYIFQDEKYIHIEADEMKKVEKCLNEKTEWFERQSNAQNATPIYEKPVVLASQIRATTEVIFLYSGFF